MQDDLSALLSASLPGVSLSAGHWRALLPLCKVRKLARGSVLFTQGQATPALFGMLAGEIEIRFSTVDGDVSVIEHVPPGRLFGLSSFASGHPSTFEALATQATRVVAFGPAAYEYLMDEVPGFARTNGRVRTTPSRCSAHARSLAPPQRDGTAQPGAGTARAQWPHG